MANQKIVMLSLSKGDLCVVQQFSCPLSVRCLFVIIICSIVTSSSLYKILIQLIFSPLHESIAVIFRTV